MKRFAFFTLLLSSTLFSAEIILDEVMSRQEQRKIGIDKLSRKEKRALEVWLNETFETKEDAQKSGSTTLSISINLDNGQRLQLSDNSIWEIAPADVAIASAWITPVRVKITTNQNPLYPYSIINTLSGVSVEAKQSNSQECEVNQN